jgi:dolichol-phosphate mannosyltransferase
MTSLSVIVPTFNEAPNIPELFARISEAVRGLDAEIVIVDDSTDDTPEVVERQAPLTTVPVRLIHRTEPVGGLSGAVIAGLESTERDWCVVMDGDLQHPPELIPTLIATGEQTAADVVVASRHVPGGSTGGLDNWVRHAVSGVSNMLTRAMFPVRLRNCSDPMTGFFALRRSSVRTAALRPRGFKILLEILARNALTVVEEPFVFGKRFAGESKADFRQGFRFLLQLTSLRFGRLSGFAVIGALGAVANLLIMAGLLSIGMWYLAAAVIAAVVTIVGNFLLQERFVFHDLRSEGRNVWVRFSQSFAFNGSELVVRTALLWLIVEATSIPSLVAQAVLLAIGFLARFAYHSRIVYRPRRTSRVSPLLGVAPPTDQQAPAPDGTSTP